MTLQPDLLPLMLLAPLLAATAWSDIRDLRIPNTLVLAALALFLVTAPMLTLGEFGARLVAAAAVFLALFAAFTLRMIGGGDVKMIPALVLFIPSAGLTAFAFVFSAALLVAVALSLGLQSRLVAGRVGWSASTARGHMPMGVAIALSGMAFPLLWTGIA